MYSTVSPRRFCRFLYFHRGGNVIFLIFRSSEPSETHFFLFSTHPRPRKHCFSHFPLVRGLGNSENAIFRSSETSDKTKIVKFGIEHTTENGKSRPAVCGKQSSHALGRCGAWDEKGYCGESLFHSLFASSFAETVVTSPFSSAITMSSPLSTFS